MIEKITTYGLPSDDFVRIVETFKLIDGLFHVERKIWLKAAVESIRIDARVPHAPSSD